MKLSITTLVALAATLSAAMPAPAEEFSFEPSLVERDEPNRVENRDFILQVSTKPPKPTSKLPTTTTAVKPTPMPSSATVTNDIKNALAAHNKARAVHNVKALTWDTALQAAAQSYANTLATTGVLEHGSTGENLYYRYPPTDGDLLLATNAWVAEGPQYMNQLIPQGNFAGYGHYTQVMWNTTQRVGMAWSRDGKGHVYVVARYDPPGNWVGQRPY